MFRYEEQLARVRRYHARIRRMYAGQPYRHDVQELHDDVHAFFVACYHLKDWLKKDPAFDSRSDNEIEEFITSCPPLALCADICNSLKHLELGRTPRSGTAPSPATQHTIHDYGDDPGAIFDNPDLPLITVRMYVRHGDVVRDALELASAAMEAWEKFIQPPPN